MATGGHSEVGTRTHFINTLQRRSDIRNRFRTKDSIRREAESVPKVVRNVLGVLEFEMSIEAQHVERRGFNWRSGRKVGAKVGVGSEAAQEQKHEELDCPVMEAVGSRHQTVVKGTIPPLPKVHGFVR